MKKDFGGLFSGNWWPEIIQYWKSKLGNFWGIPNHRQRIVENVFTMRYHFEQYSENGLNDVSSERKKYYYRNFKFTKLHKTINFIECETVNINTLLLMKPNGILSLRVQNKLYILSWAMFCFTWSTCIKLGGFNVYD